MIHNDPTPSVVQAFDELEDPRKQAGRFQYPLQEMLLTALCAVYVFSPLPRSKAKQDANSSVFHQVGPVVAGIRLGGERPPIHATVTSCR